MSDIGKPNGNGLLHQITETKERMAAWLMRGLLASLMALSSAFGWVVWGEFTRMRNAFEDNGKLIWQNLQRNDKSIGVLTQTLTDHIREDQDAIGQLRTVSQDHENRLRFLERPTVVRHN